MIEKLKGGRNCEKILQRTIKKRFRQEILKPRSALGYTQEKMANTLFLSTRAYVALESGKSCCSQDTFFILLQHCCLDRKALMEGILNDFDSYDNCSSF